MSRLGDALLVLVLVFLPAVAFGCLVAKGLS